MPLGPFAIAIADPGLLGSAISERRSVTGDWITVQKYNKNKEVS
jgi:hypothetical protein